MPAKAKKQLNIKPKVLFGAQASGFGPVSKMLEITKLFQSYEIVFLGEGTALDFVEKHGNLFSKVYDSKKLNNKTKSRLIKSCQFAVIVMDHKLSYECYRAKKRFYFFDSLFGFWNLKQKDLQVFSKLRNIAQRKRISLEAYKKLSVHEKKVLSHAMSELSFVQSNLNLEKRLKTYKSVFKKDIHLIYPIVDPMVRLSKSAKTQVDNLIINLGGVRNFIVKKNSIYLKLILKLSQDFIYDNICKKVTIYCGAQNKPTQKHDLISMKFSKKEQFLKIVNSSDLVMSSPGLTSIYEFLYSGKPVVYLPEQHLSQYYNTRNLKKTFLRNTTVSFFDILDNNLSENDYHGSAQILKIVQRFIDEPPLYTMLKNKLEKALVNMTRTNQKEFKYACKKLVGRLEKNAMTFKKVFAIIQNREKT